LEGTKTVWKKPCSKVVVRAWQQGNRKNSEKNVSQSSLRIQQNGEVVVRVGELKNRKNLKIKNSFRKKKMASFGLS
jgi:hypothetical protein